MSASPARTWAQRALVASLVAGCSPEGSLGKASSAQSESDSASDADASTSMGSQTSSASTTASGTSGGGSTDTSESGSGTGGGTSTDGGTGGDCHGSPDDDECTMCRKLNCCQQVLDCGDDPACHCIDGCVQGGEMLDTCMAMCGDDGGLYDALNMCTHGSCQAMCG